MNRRGFLGSIAALMGAAALDPEQLLWIPGQKTIFIPPGKVFTPRFLIGAAINRIDAGNYGYVQVFGPTAMDTNYPCSFRRIKTSKEIHAGEMVYSDQSHVEDMLIYGNGHLVLCTATPLPRST